MSPGEMTHGQMIYWLREYVCGLEEDAKEVLRRATEGVPEGATKRERLTHVDEFLANSKSPLVREMGSWAFMLARGKEPDLEWIANFHPPRGGWGDVARQGRGA
jgi:hypothetical protein